MYSKSVTYWLWFCVIMVLSMVLLGGLTRLTESGLSMTHWKPITGWLPPYTDILWEKEFASYQQSPQFKYLNAHMDLADFKNIFWLEFIHRLVGRISGIIFLLPLVYFSIHRMIDRKFAFQLTGLFALGGLQAIVGWYMVKSGLQDIPYVSHYWLAGHLLVATAIFAGLLRSAWYSMGIKRGQFIPQIGIYYLTRLFFLLVITQLFLGALVAGLDAGLIYNSFPDMDGKYIPDGLWSIERWYRNFVENRTLVQFEHRILGLILLLIGFVISWKLWYKQTISNQWLGLALGLILLLQVGLGVVILLLQVPVWAASLHQIIGMILVAISFFINYTLRLSSSRVVVF